ncbi:unnamed protein product [Mytilus edulis]|uniref:Uncharacterized protein n=1 Tax=Mytilus edulis TaxID=6550 RepID=A0A8S3Q495_MYTED|nr:unnamed protein product [Mytilus edulis]
MSEALPRNHPLPVETTNGYRRLYSLEEQSAVPDCRNDHPSDLQLQMSVVNLNTCSFQELLQLPGIGIKTGEQIMDIRESKGSVIESDLATISHLRVTRSLLSRLDFSPNGGGQNIGPPPQAQGRHGEMLNRGHIAPQGTPSQVQGQSAFRQEAWHQGQSPGPLKGPSQMDSAFLEYSPYPGDANARHEPTGNWDGGYREQLQKKEWSHHDIGDPNQGSPPHHMYRGSIGNKPYWPGKDSAWDKLTPELLGHTFTPHGSCMQLCRSGVSTLYPTSLHWWGTVLDGADTRQTPSHDYGDRQPKNQYNQGYTAVPHKGSPQGNSSQAPLQEAAYLADRQGQKVATTVGGGAIPKWNAQIMEVSPSQGVPPLIEGLHGRECATIVLSLDMLRRTVWIYRRGIELLPPQFSQAEQQQDH